MSLIFATQLTAIAATALALLALVTAVITLSCAFGRGGTFPAGTAGAARQLGAQGSAGIEGFPS